MKNIFSYNADIHKTAYLNWRTREHKPILNMINLAKGYMESSLMLAKQALINNNDKKADIIIFPILFTANHAIELYLKAITWSLNILLDNGRKIEGKHNIKQIFNVVVSRVNEFEDDHEKKQTFNKLTVNLKSYIDELFNKIEDEFNRNNANMDFSRYPFSLDYDNHFYIDDFKNVVVDLENFIERFEEIGKNLHIIAHHYYYEYLEEEGCYG